MTTRYVGKQARFDYYESDPEAIEIGSWCPTPKPTVPPTQVHLTFPIAEIRVVFRFKGPATLDRLIAALQEHRKDVWG